MSLQFFDLQGKVIPYNDEMEVGNVLIPYRFMCYQLRTRNLIPFVFRQLFGVGFFNQRVNMRRVVRPRGQYFLITGDLTVTNMSAEYVLSRLREVGFFSMDGEGDQHYFFNMIRDVAGAMRALSEGEDILPFFRHEDHIFGEESEIVQEGSEEE